MKKNSMLTLVAFLNGQDVDVSEAKAELEAELAKDAERAQVKGALYDSAKEIVMGELRVAEKPVTIGELFSAVEDKLPEGFTKGMVQYAITKRWADEVGKVEGNPNTYFAK